MTLQFEPISIEKQEPYLSKLNQSHWQASDYSFINLWSWGPEYGLMWAWDDGLAWLQQTKEDPVLWAPVGPWEEIDWKERFEKHFDSVTRFARVPEALLQLWQKYLGDRLQVDQSEEHWDYLYNVSDLVNLTGNVYHSKQNLLNQFTRKYTHDYVELTPDRIEMALAMQETWCEWRECEEFPPLAAENRAIARVFKDWNRLENTTGGAIMVGGEMAAFCVAEEISPETILIHFEKGLLTYKGVYQAINQMFLAANGDYNLVNREQDLGNEGLRRAKQSYHPVDYVRKYSVTYLP